MTAKRKRKAPKTAFKKGHPRPLNSGRKKGTPNKLTRQMRELVQVAIAVAGGGGDEGALGYLVDCAQNDRVPFLSLLGKTIERHVTVEHKPLELVVVHNFTGMSPAKLRKLGPSILGAAKGK